jgi:uncharacterized membrane protein
MEQQIGLTRTTRTRRPAWLNLNYRWMNLFFTKNLSPGYLTVIDLQRRATWIGLALLCQSLVGVTPSSTIIQGLQGQWYLPFLELCGGLLPLGLTIGGIFAMWKAIKPVTLRQQLESTEQHGGRPQRMALLRTIILFLIGSVVAIVIIVQCFLPPAFSNDGTSLDTNAAQLLLQGKNPYTASSILDIARDFDIQPGWTTPLRVGQFSGKLDYPSSVEIRSTFDTALKAGQAPEFESKVSYPALSFLTLVPFALLKFYNVLPFYLLCYILLAWIAWKVSKQQLRPWILLFTLANVPMLTSVIGGNLDIFYILLLVLAWLLREKRWQSAIFLGLAMASKQIAWFFVPFYLMMIWRNLNRREAIYRAVIAGMVVVLINLPFMIWNPGAWLAGVLAPMADPMFPLGVGLIDLSAFHLLPYLPSWVYLLLEMGAMGGALVVYWRICRVCPEAAMLLAVVPLFFAWRSLPSYFSCTAFPLFILMVARRQTTAEKENRLKVQT